MKEPAAGARGEDAARSSSTSRPRAAARIAWRRLGEVLALLAVVAEAAVFIAPLEAISLLRPHLALALAAFALPALLRRELVRGAIYIAAGAWAVWPVAPYWVGSPADPLRRDLEPGRAPSLRVVVLACGDGEDGARRALDRGRALDADVLVVRGEGLDGTAHVSAFAEPFVHRVVDESESAGWIALASRHPLLDARPERSGVPACRAIRAVLEIRGQAVVVWAVRSPWALDEEVRAALGELVARARLDLDASGSERALGVVAGSFGLAPWSAALGAAADGRELEDCARGFGVLGTWPALAGPLALPVDRVLVGPGWRVVDCEVHDPVGGGRRTLSATLVRERGREVPEPRR